MNKKIVTFCSSTLEKMINYHHDKKGIDKLDLISIINDLKKLMQINRVNLLIIAQHDNPKNIELFEKIHDLLISNYIQSEIVKHWLQLFITNPEIRFEELIEAADIYISKVLEISINIGDSIELNEMREKQILNTMIKKVLSETEHESDYLFYIVFLKTNNEVQKTLIYSRDKIKAVSSDGMNVSKKELLNTIFDYFIINNPKEQL